MKMKKMTALLACLLLCLGMLGAAGVFADEGEPVNLIPEGTAVTSSGSYNDSAEFGADKILPGTDGRWVSKTAAQEQWLELDFKQEITADTIVQAEVTEYSNGDTIVKSITVSYWDGDDWVEWATAADNPFKKNDTPQYWSGGEHIARLELEAKTFSKLRFEYEWDDAKKEDNLTMCFMGLYLENEPEPQPVPDGNLIPDDTDVIASGEYDGYPAAYILPVNNGQRWVSETQGQDQWLEFDFKKPIEFNQLVQAEVTEYSGGTVLKQYTVSYWDDSANKWELWGKDVNSPFNEADAESWSGGAHLSRINLTKKSVSKIRIDYLYDTAKNSENTTLCYIGLFYDPDAVPDTWEDGPEPQPGPGDNVVPAGTAVTSCAYHDGGYSPANVLTTDLAYRWATNSRGGELYLEFDFKKEITFNKMVQVRATEFDANTKGYTVFTWKDGGWVEWETDSRAEPFDKRVDTFEQARDEATFVFQQTLTTSKLKVVYANADSANSDTSLCYFALYNDPSATPTNKKDDGGDDGEDPYEPPTPEVELKTYEDRNGTGIKFEAEEGAVPEGAELYVGAIAGGTAQYEIIQTALGSSAVKFTAYNLSLLQEDGESIGELDDAVVFTIPLPQGYDASLCRIYNVTEDGVKIDMKAEIKDGALVFSTSVFGYFALAQMEAEAGGNETPNPNPSPSTGVAVPVALAVLTAASAATAMALKKKKES